MVLEFACFILGLVGYLGTLFLYFGWLLVVLGFSESSVFGFFGFPVCFVEFRLWGLYL